MTIPDYQTLMLPVLEAVSKQTEAKSGELAQVMASQFGLGAAEIAQKIPSGKQPLISNRTHWAITYLAKAGLLERHRRGYIRITERGRETLRKKPVRIDVRYLRQFPEFLAFHEAGAEVDAQTVSVVPEEKSTPDDAIRSAHSLIVSALRSDLLERILQEDPASFERVVVRLLVAMGFGGKDGTAAAIGKSGDGGLDGIINEDALGLDRVYIQAKRYKAGNTVGSPEILQFSGALNQAQADKGVFVTTSSFTPAAKQTAERLPQRIVLIDGDRLADLMIRYDVGVRIAETFHIKKIDEDFFLE